MSKAKDKIIEDLRLENETLKSQHSQMLIKATQAISKLKEWTKPIAKATEVRNQVFNLVQSAAQWEGIDSADTIVDNATLIVNEINKPLQDLQDEAAKDAVALAAQIASDDQGDHVQDAAG